MNYKCCCFLGMSVLLIIGIILFWNLFSVSNNQIKSNSDFIQQYCTFVAVYKKANLVCYLAFQENNKTVQSKTDCVYENSILFNGISTSCYISSKNGNNVTFQAFLNKFDAQYYSSPSNIVNSAIAFSVLGMIFSIVFSTFIIFWIIFYCIRDDTSSEEKTFLLEDL